MGVAYSVGEVDHLYTFFVQWSPESIYSKHTSKQDFLKVHPETLNVIDTLLNNSAPKNWKIVTVKQQKRRPSVCSSADSESEDLQPVLVDHSQILKEQHLEQLMNHIPARTQGYPWKLVYSTAEHGTSLRTLYRQMAEIDRPVLMVIKDSDNQVFGAFSSDPFKVSSYCYGTGETFLYSFSPEFQIFRWSGENSYFVRGFLDSLQMGGGGGPFGLWLDADLYRGSSYSCDTFCNRPLSLHHDFTIQDLEVWTFI
ncbi:nuclear receptor coactivator 7 isoform X2 [Megalobrama amblycephala]|uniref:nuclear receptor coactivator 7 isoform X2 n=1 Tax=Megalobrama amblycephala TaxID=75352 RepID=UPI0020147A65|nr:nuclear receptor coactivator 7 isoform X2 [Megalobrama amblycephala]